MRFARFRSAGEVRPAVLLDDMLLDLRAAEDRFHCGLPMTSRALFDPGARARIEALQKEIKGQELRATLLAAGALVEYATADLAAPVDDPALLLGIGMNYHDHLREMNAAVPGAPYSFTKNSASIVGPMDPIELPRSNPAMVDLEGELVIVIGSSCYGVAESDAAHYIGGYTIANDVSARDWAAGAFCQESVMDTVSAWGLNLLGKQFPTFCPIGPCIVTSDELPDINNLALTTRINGEPFQSSNTSQMIFSPVQIVSYLSQFYRLGSGDLILTGTPAGVGFGRKPARFFAAGDVVEVEIATLGSLRNPVVSAA